MVRGHGVFDAIGANGFSQHTAIACVVYQNINLGLRVDDFVTKVSDRLERRQVQIMEYHFTVFTFGADFVCWRLNQQMTNVI